MLELGCGEYSTPMLASVAAAQSRKLTVVSSDSNWLAKYSYLESPDCELCLIERKEWPRVDLEGDWGFVLLDNEQTVNDRFRLLKKLAHSARLVVFHDANVLEESGRSWQPISRLFRYIYVDRRREPSTAVVSNDVDPSVWLPKK